MSIPEYQDPAETADGVADPAGTAMEVSDVLRRVAAAALELTPADGAYVEQVMDGEVEIVAVAGWGAPPLGTRVPYPGSVTEEMVEAAVSVRLLDLSGVGPSIAPYLADHCSGCSALLSPIVIGRELLGALVLLRTGGQPFDISHETAIRSLGELASVALRLVREVEREREERTALLDSTGEGIYGIDPAGRCTFINRSAARLLGYERDAVLGANMHGLIHHSKPDGSPYREDMCPIYHAARAGEAVRVENEVLWRRDGTSFPAEYGSYPIREDGKTLGAVVTFRDISDRKRAEEERARSLERERFLSESSTVLGSSLDYEATLDRLAHLAVPRIADYCLIDVREADGRLHRVGAAHVDAAREAILEAVQPYAPAPGSGSPALAVLETGQPELVPEVTDAYLDRVAQGPEHREVMRSLGPRSVVVVPLAGRARTVGLLWLARTHGEPYGEPDLTTAVELGRRAGVAVDHAMLFRAAQEARGEAERRAREEEALREAIGAVSASASTGEVIQRVAGSAVRATNADGAFVERIDPECAESVVVAASGETAPAVGSRMRYSGSLTERVVEGAEPLVVPRVVDAGHRLSAELVSGRPDDAMLVLPLVDGGAPIGALFLLRRVSKRPFRDDEIQRALSFAELAALAFRKIHMLEESEQRREELQTVMESRARLMRGFSHDVKNPLGAADGYLQLLQDRITGDLTDKQADHVRRARRSIRGSLRLIEDLLELARAEAGQLTIEWGPVDVRDAARELGEEYRVQAERKGLAMRLDLPADLPIIRSDANRVRQILGNLFSNAVKYTEQGEIRVAVAMRTRTASSGARDWIVTEVRDTGPGVPDEERDRLFEEFTRGASAGAGGAGIGLAISQRLARALGGEITLESEVGAGSTFTLWLPRSEPV
ncbi:MAG: GAF domain-containing protein [Gemmatimonadota bacterium]